MLWNSFSSGDGGPIRLAAPYAGMAAHFRLEASGVERPLAFRFGHHDRRGGRSIHGHLARKLQNRLPYPGVTL